MNRKWRMRAISALICLALLTASAPVRMEGVAVDNGAAPAIEEALVAPEAAFSPEADVAQEPVEAIEEIPEAICEGEAQAEPPARPGGESAESESAEPADARNAALNEIVEGWISDLNALGYADEYHRALWLYDRVIANFERGEGADALEALTTLRAGAKGYASALEALLRAAGIECRTIVTERDAWNLAKLDGAWTHIDAYADDAPELYGAHFGLNDAAMRRERDWAGDLPACEGVSNNYYVRERGYRTFANRDELRALLASAVEAREERLLLVDASADGALDSLGALLAEIDTSVAAELSGVGCRAEVNLRYAPPAVEQIPGAEGDLEEGAESEGAAHSVVSDELAALLAPSEADAASTEADDASTGGASVPVAQIQTSPERLTLCVGGSAAIDFSLQPDGASGAIHYESSSECIASVDESGAVTANSVGAATITLTADGSDARAEVPVTVKLPPAGIALSIDKDEPKAGNHRLESDGDGYAITLGAGDEIELRAALEPKGSAGEIKYATTDGGVAKVEGGRLVAVDSGAADITATTFDGVQSVCHVTVVPAPADDDLQITLGEAELGAGQTTDLRFGLSDGVAGASFGYAIAGKSGGSDVVTYDAATGVLTAQRAGTATVTMTAYNGATVQKTVTVKAAPSSVSLTRPVSKLGVGESFTVDQQKYVSLNKNAFAGDVKLVSKAASVLSVEQVAEGSWKLTAHKAGTAKLYAKTYNGIKSAEVSVTVEAAPSSVALSLSNKKTELIVGETVTLQKSFAPSKCHKGANLTFSDNNEIVKYDAQSGALTALGPGTVTITAAAYNYDPHGDGEANAKLFDVLSVTVKQAVTNSKQFGVALAEGARNTIGVGETAKLQAVFADESGALPGAEGYAGAHYAGAVSWSVKPTRVATIKGGVVTAVAPGTATVTAKINGKANSFPIYVLSKATVAAAQSEDGGAIQSAHLSQGERLTAVFKISGYAAADGQEGATVPTENLFRFSYSNLAEESLRYSADGKTATLTVRATKGAGTGKITATAPGGASRSLSIALSPALEEIALGEGALNLLPGKSATIQATLTGANSKPNLSWTVEPDGGLLQITSVKDNQITVKLDAAAAEDDVKRYTIRCAAPGCDQGGEPICAERAVAVAKLPDAPDFGTIALTKAQAEGSTAVVLGAGESLTASVRFNEGYAGTVTWKIDSESAGRATVNQSGKVTAMTAGAAPVKLVATVNGQSIETEFYVASAVTKVAFARKVTALGVGESFEFGGNISGYTLADGTPAGVAAKLDDGKVYSFTSSDSSIVRVDDKRSGKVTARKAGTATVTLKAYNAASGDAKRKVSVKITVKKKLGANGKDFALSPGARTLAKGETLVLKAELGGGYANLAWAAEPAKGIRLKKLKNEQYSVTITDEAEVGEVTVTATAQGYEGRSASATIRAVDAYAPGDFHIKDPAKTVIGAGETLALAAGAADDAHGGAITWSTSNASVATVSAAGKVTGKKAGAVTITATAFNSTAGEPISDKLQLTVIGAPTLTLDDGKSARSVKLGIGEEMTLALKQGGYTSGNQAVKAAIDRTGLYRAVANSDEAVVSVSDALKEDDRITLRGERGGKSTVTIKTYNNKAVTLSVTVADAPLREIAIDDYALAKGDAVAPAVRFIPANSYANVAWSISGAAAGITLNSKTGAVSASATKAKVKSTATVTATATVNGSEISDSCTVTVANAPVKATSKNGSKMTVSVPKAKIAVGERVTATVNYALEGTAGSVSWKSSNAKIAKVSKTTGAITGVKAGTATITATSFNGKLTATKKITVVKAPASISFKPGAMGVFAGEKYDLDVTLPASYKGTVLAKAKEEQETLFSFKVAQDESGVIEDLDPRSGAISIAADAQPGASASVTVTTCNNKSKALALTVLAEPRAVALRQAASDGEFASIALSLGEQFTPAVVVTGEAGELANASVHWVLEGNEEGYLSIDQATGELSARKVTPDGANVTVHAVAKEGVSGNYSVTVDPLPAKDNMQLQLARSTLGKGETTTIRFQFTGEAAARIHDKAVSFRGGSGQKYVSITNTVENGDGSYTLSVKGKTAGKSEKIIAKAANGVEVSKTVKVVAAPTKLALKLDRTELGIGEELALSATLSPSGSAGAITYSVDDEGVAEVVERDGKTLLIARTNGVVTLSAKTYVKSVSASAKITVKNRPESISVSKKSLVLGLGADSANVGAKVNAGSAGKLSYELVAASGSGSVSAKTATIDKNGKITTGPEKGGKTGKFRVKVSTYAEEVKPQYVDVEVKAAPSKIAFGNNNYFVVRDDSKPFDLKSKLTLTPADSATTLKYTIGTKGYFTIDADGKIPAGNRKLKKGQVYGKSKVTVKTHNGKTDSATVWIVPDLDTPQIIKITSTKPSTLKEGKSYTPTLAFYPTSADKSMKWTISNSKIASINKTTGKVTQKAYGKVTVTGTSVKNPKLKVKYTLTVMSDKVCLVMPAHRTTSKSAIKGNLTKIDKVESAALKTLSASKAPSKSARKAAIQRGFDMYRFAWHPTAYIPYWRAANSEGGHKDFKTNTYYFGMPYTQSNRIHSDLYGYTTKAKDYNYYNTTSAFNSKGRSYPGSDCSSFCSMATWGTGSSRRSDTTSRIASAGYYSRGDWYNMYPGDLICSGGHHVVMFLYYASIDKSQIVVLEQGGGGSDLYSNCIATAIHDISYYASDGYKPLRPNY